MDSDQELSECPLCLEALEADDLNFFPCTCCYQICRFCWHRIRTDENGLCPACRKPYSENPAQFKPLTDEEIQQAKRDRKFKESGKKPKITESRKHLTNLRVVQRNLVFVNGLPSRLADTELLRRNDHFGKYGKIVKLVTSPAHNGQLNSICVYITYSRSEEALRAIQALCNYQVDGRTLKATLGTTKYCSRYLKGAVCQKADCLYLHEPGDPLASFTKEQMQQGLHLDYERKLMEQFSNQTASGTPKSNRTTANGNKSESLQKRPVPFIPPLLTSGTDSNGNIQLTAAINGHSDLESGDETHSITTNISMTHPIFNGFNNDAFPSTTVNNGDALNGDSDSSSTSSHTSSEHESLSRTQHTNNHASSAPAWPEQSTSLFNGTHLVPSTQPTTNATSSSLSPSNLQMQLSSTETKKANSTVKNVDQMPEYKLFGSNTPSIHTLFFGANENIQTRQQSHQSMSNGIDQQLNDLSKRLLETDFSNSNKPPTFLQTQESDELGFDPCSVFMSELAHDVEDERRPTSSSNTLFPQRLNFNPCGFSSQYNPSNTGTNSSSWMMQQQQQQQLQPHQYNSYHEQPTTPQKENRYPTHLNGSSPRQMWNTGQQTQIQPQYSSHIPTHLEFSNQIPQIRQPSPSTQYPPTINHSYPSNGNVSNLNVSVDRWMNPSRTDSSAIGLGNKIDSISSQWSLSASMQGGSTLSSGNNLISTTRWPQSHMFTNGIYMPYSTASAIDDGSRP